MPSSTHVALSLLDHLNPEQHAAVTLPTDQHALILAGAGSGKTRVLTTRIAWLLHQQQATPGSILAVTFTNKAAREMLTRLASLLPVSVRGMWMGTFHGLCNRMLRIHHQLVGLPLTFQILDTQDQLAAVKRLCKQANVTEEKFPAKQLAWFISNCKEQGLRPQQLEAKDEHTRQKIELYQLYEQQCQREGVVDFGELMLRCYELLQTHTALRQHYQQRFSHILVDEFQDTNPLQYAWLKQLAGEMVDGRMHCSGSVIAVGDDDQSIYAFRGARVDNMHDFVREFAVQQHIRLEQNYRSSTHILDAANALIAHNTHRLGKNLRTDQATGEPVRIYEAAQEHQEARWIADEIQQLTTHDGMAAKEIAVLYRSNAQSRVLESALFNSAIPYRVYGGLRFFERAEIKHALAYLRLLENPHDDTSFLRVVNFPPRGIGTRTLEALQDCARGGQRSFYQVVDDVPGKGRNYLMAFISRINTMRTNAQGKNLGDTIAHVLEISGLMEHYRNERDGSERVDNLEELLSAASSFIASQGFAADAAALPLDEQGAGTAPSVDTEQPPTFSPLAAFLAHAALEAGDNQAEAGKDAVQLMTIHASKGLEFDCVFISGLEEGLFPHNSAMNEGDKGLEEERRLMYVAITRARKRLYLSWAQSRMLHGNSRWNVRSRFFDELPENALKWLTPRKNKPDAARDTGAGQAFEWNRFSFSKKSGNAAPLLPPKAKTSPPTGKKRAPTAPSPHGDLRVGLAVFHGKFGEGKVLALEGTADNARAHIHFPRHGSKWLALAVAKLTVVE